MEGVPESSPEEDPGGRWHDAHGFDDGQIPKCALIPRKAYQIKVDEHSTSDSIRKTTDSGHSKQSTGSRRLRLASGSPTRKSVRFSRGSGGSISGPQRGDAGRGSGSGGSAASLEPREESESPRKDPTGSASTPSGLRPLVGFARRSLSGISFTSDARNSRRGSVASASSATQGGFAKKKARSFLEPDSSTVELDPGLRRGLTATSIAQSEVSSSAGDNSARAGGIGFPAWIKFNRLRLWLFLEEPFVDWKSSALSSLMLVIIGASLYHSIRLHEQDSKATWEATWNDQARVTDSTNSAFNIVFCFDLALRLVCSPSCRYFLRHPKNFIDLLSVMPFFCCDVLDMPAWTLWLRPLRHLSSYEAFLRLLRLARYFWGWHLLLRAIRESVKALVIPIFFLILMVMLSSCTLYVVETLQLASQGLTEAELKDMTLEEKVEGGFVTIRSLPAAMHFSIICMLSMETGPFYGLQAASAVGQTVAVCLMFFGMTFMAMPIAIVGSVFADTWFHQDRLLLLENVRTRLQAQGYEPQELWLVFDEIDKDCSGELSFEEFMTMINALNLRSLTPAKCRNLFRYFDTDCDGQINFSDFSLTLFPDHPIAEDLRAGSHSSQVTAASSSTSKEPGEESRTSGASARSEEWNGGEESPRLSSRSARTNNARASTRCSKGPMSHDRVEEKASIPSTSSVDEYADARRRRAADTGSSSDSSSESEDDGTNKHPANRLCSDGSQQASRHMSKSRLLKEHARRLEEMARQLEETFETRMNLLSASMARQQATTRGTSLRRSSVNVGLMGGMFGGDFGHGEKGNGTNYSIQVSRHASVSPRRASVSALPSPRGSRSPRASAGSLPSRRQSQGPLFWDHRCSGASAVSLASSRASSHGAHLSQRFSGASVSMLSAAPQQDRQRHSGGDPARLQNLLQAGRRKSRSHGDLGRVSPTAAASTPARR